MRSFMIGIGMLLCATVASAAPRVANSDLATVPEAWRAEWKPYEAKVSEERAQEGVAQGVLDEAQRELDRAQRALEAAEALTTDAKKQAKKAKKSKDTEAARAAATARADAEHGLVDARRAHSKAAAAVSVAAAKLELEQAESELAEARLHRAQAQAVADSGGWVDVARFDESVSQSKAKVDAATKALAQAESMAVLALQGS